MKFIRAKAKSKAGRQKGYMLLAVMLTVTVMLLALSVALPRVTQQIKREKEEELIHRGKEYAMAIKRFYHSPASRGTYPTSLDQLDNTNNMRFLRKHFKDPMTVDGEWKLIHFGEAQIMMSGAPGGTGSLATSPLSGMATPSPSPSPSASPGTLGSGLGGNVGGVVQSPGGGLGSLQTTGSPLQAGGFIIGVASKSKETSIKEFNGTNQYDQWLFVFDPRMECALPAAAAPAAGAPAATGISAATPGSPAPCAGNGVTIAAPQSPSSSPANPPVPGASVSPTPVPGISPPPAPGTSPTPVPGISPPPVPGTSPTPGMPTPPPQH